MMKRSVLIIFAVLIALPVLAFGDEDFFDGDFFSDDFFFDDMIEDIDEFPDAYLDLLTSDSVDIGGRFSSSISAGASWTDSSNITDVFFMRAAGNIFLDARPSEKVRVFTKAKIEYPYPSKGSSFRIFEFFTDLSWKERVFIRAGKQVVNWSTGGFWSPANILSIGEIDPDEPGAELEGPLALKVSMPVRQHTLDLFLVGKTVSENYSMDDLKVVPRAILYVPPAQITLGAGYQYAEPLELVASASVPRGDITLFTEGKLSISSSNIDGEGTIGVRWMPENRDLFVIGQYYYSQAGMHQSMLALTLTEIIHPDLSASVRWHAIWNNNAGLISAEVGRLIFEGFKVTGGVTAWYGPFPNFNSSRYSAYAGVDLTSGRF